MFEKATRRKRTRSELNVLEAVQKLFLILRMFDEIDKAISFLGPRMLAVLPPESPVPMIFQQPVSRTMRYVPPIYVQTPSSMWVDLR